ncbi:lamin tail domain-containing protein 1 isoform X2 [Dasypus novemcinctus]|uniref:lamin tail domain-containing protein 1 isoform X2 n=1 Tax=Dasypus novemcinctus TaxID=9361 RepID=UPI00265FE5A7|nr:lamin tail domain-containing protein 1 isoform X2 [Dasypus novemcinctus]
MPHAFPFTSRAPNQGEKHYQDLHIHIKALFWDHLGRESQDPAAALTGKKTSPLAKMKTYQALQASLASKQSEVSEQEDKEETSVQREDDESPTEIKQRSFVRFFPVKTSSDATIPPLSPSVSYEVFPLYYVPSSQISRQSSSTLGQKPSKSSLVTYFKAENSLGTSHLVVSKKQPLSVLVPEAAVNGEEEDYFHSLFDDSKLLPSTSQDEKTCKHFSMILEEVGSARSSALGDIKIAEVNVKGLFVKLVNSSTNKELDIGDHILQQKMNGQTVSFYQFAPHIIMQANSSVTVWAAASEAQHQPPSNFLWKEQNEFTTTPNCTTILCKPNGEAIAWYTPIHWKQAWEKLDTDIEFRRCSISVPTSQRSIFWRPIPTTTITKNRQDAQQKDTFPCQREKSEVLLKREKEIRPALLPTCSPWCHSPDVPPHPYCSLTGPHNVRPAGSSLGAQPRSPPAKLDPAPDRQKS